MGCKHRSTKIKKYQHFYFGTSLRSYWGEAEVCNSCGKIVKDSYQTPKGVKVTNGTASVILPYNNKI